MVTEQASSAGRGGLFSSYSVAAGVLVSPDVGVPSVVSWWVAVTPVVIIFWACVGRACSSVVPVYLNPERLSRSSLSVS